MKLKLISIRNWRKIKKMDIHFNELMLFLGQSIEGTNNVTSALSFAFNKSPLDISDIAKGSDYAQLKLIFIIMLLLLYPLLLIKVHWIYLI